MADEQGTSNGFWTALWARLDGIWANVWQRARRWWIFWTLASIAAVVVVLFHGTKQPIISTLPTYLLADAATEAPHDGGTSYCSNLGSALVQYSGFSRLCAWTAFFLGLLSGGIAVVIGSDDQVPQHAGLGQRLLLKHRNVGLLLIAALCWITAYSSFVRIGTAAETVNVLTAHIAKAETRRANARALLAPTSRITVQAAVPEGHPVSSALTTDKQASSSPATDGRLGEGHWSEERRKARERRIERALDEFNETLDRELFASCVAARGTWEVNRTKSFELAESVALGRTRELLDYRKEAERVAESADDAQKQKTDAKQDVATAENLKNDLRASLSGPAPNDTKLVEDTTKLAAAATTAAKAAAEVERATSRAVNMTAGIDAAMAAALRTSVSELRIQVEEANQAAANATESAGSTTSKPAERAEKVAAEAEKAARAASNALDLATTVTDTVQAAAATQSSAAPN